MGISRRVAPTIAEGQADTRRVVRIPDFAQ